jgi:hypothetical protein
LHSTWAKQAFWIENLVQNTLPVKHYHVIFTVPHVLNTVCLHNQRLYYDLLFAAVWHTLRSFGYSHYGVETGAVAVLHTWGQNLSLHPHIHCLVPAAGYALDDIQHRLIAGSCIPLRVLFIIPRFFFFLSLKLHSSNTAILERINLIFLFIVLCRCYVLF